MRSINFLDGFFDKRGEPMIPMACINGDCQRVGVKVYNGKRCKGCDGDLYPYEDYEFTDVPLDEVVFSGDGEMTDSVRDYIVTAAGNPSSFPLLATVAEEDETFTCTSDLSGCPIAKQVTVDIPLELYNQWVFLANEIDTEWIAYLTGEEVDPDHVVVREMYFPKQKANGSHVEAEEGEIQAGTIAAVHSHVNFSVFFSAEDVRHMNHHVELVVNREGKLKANGRVKLECGRFHRGDAKIRLINSEANISLLQELKDKLTEEHYGGVGCAVDLPKRKANGQFTAGL
jgi:proteasome lid subunit RPN8/RPN11